MPSLKPFILCQIAMFLLPKNVSPWNNIFHCLPVFVLVCVCLSVLWFLHFYGIQFSHTCASLTYYTYVSICVLQLFLWLLFSVQTTVCLQWCHYYCTAHLHFSFYLTALFARSYLYCYCCTNYYYVYNFSDRKLWLRTINVKKWPKWKSLDSSQCHLGYAIYFMFAW